MKYIIETAQKQTSKLRISLAAPSGGGKTYSSLRMAYGITNDWSKIGVIDTEQKSSANYKKLGDFKLINLEAPYTPDNYIGAIQAFEIAGMEVIIIDSVTHIWKGRGGLLEYQNALGGRFQDWAKTTPMYQKFIDSILQSKCHMITTIRKKEGYALSTEGGKTKVTKQGMDDEIRDGYSYEMTVAFDLNINHLAESSKDRTGLFMKSDGSNEAFMITEETGKQLKQWAESGITPTIDTPQQKQPTPTENKPKATEAQVKHIYTLAGLKGLSNDEIKAKANVESMKDVSKERAGKIIEWLIAKPDIEKEVKKDPEPEEDEFIKSLENEK